MRGFCFLVSILVIWYCSIQVFKINYQDFCIAVLSSYQKLDKLAVFQENYLTWSRFFYLRLLMVFGSFVGWTLIFWNWKFLKRSYRAIQVVLKTSLSNFFITIRLVYYELQLIEKLALIFPLLVYIVFWWVYGWHIDEVFSYTFFVDKGFLVCATYYPAPNNHVAYSLVSAILDQFLVDFIAIKLPATIFAWLSLISIWGFFYRYYSKTLAWMMFFAVALLWDFFFYASHGRGYSLLVLCGVWQTIAFFQLQTSSLQQQNYSWWTVWVISNSIGCYAVPVFVYTWFGSVLAIWLLTTKTLRWQSIIASFCVGICLLVLYAPILLFNGLDALIANDWIKPLSFNTWINAFPIYFFDVHFPIGFLAFLVSAFLFLKNDVHRRVILYAWIMLFSPYILLVFQNVFPFERTWIVGKVVELILFIWASYEIVHKKIEKQKIITYAKRGLFIFFATSAIFRMIYEYWHWNIRVNEYHFAPQLAKNIKTIKPNAVLVLEDTYNVFLRYEFRASNLPIDVQPTQQIYDVILLPKNTKLNTIGVQESLYHEFYEDDFISGFKLLENSQKNRKK